MTDIYRKITDLDGRDLRLRVKFENTSIYIAVIKDGNAFYQLVTKSYIQEQARKHEMDFVKYYENFQKYLNQDSNVSFALEKDVFTMYRIVNPNNKMKVKYFFVTLNKCDYHTCMETIADEFYENIVALTAQVDKMSLEYNELKNEKTLIEDRIQKFVAKKSESDKKMLSNFLLVLNEKKKRIQHLSDLLEAVNAGRPTVNQPPKAISKQGTKKSFSQVNIKSEQKEKISDTESSESEQEAVKEVEAVPSTSKTFLDDILKDDSPPRKVKIKAFKPANQTQHVSVSKKLQSVEEKKEKDATISVEQDSPTLDFSTQDLLDRL